ncbi:hypothetical protein BDV41DRAFT_543112 [Aspergillus transmontanensis]|uniref:Translation initiation factor 5A C-terminal domain-containing protein n=1 Tax=Aspergillus transmontanensis TaxID=1034304 RepID=A0A5N6VR36_9EURO|nr:hypothetical protein BDV41DRAFT_543112 [Aspergillus transmontanensis]
MFLSFTRSSAVLLILINSFYIPISKQSLQYSQNKMSNDEQHNHMFGQAWEGAPATFFMQASALRKNGHMVIHGRPCKIAEVSSSRTECHFVALDLFSGKELETTAAPDANIEVPNVLRTEYQFSYTDDNMLYLLTSDGSEKSDVHVPNGEIGDKISEFEEAGLEAIITVMSAMGEEAAIAIREAPK